MQFPLSSLGLTPNCSSLPSAWSRKHSLRAFHPTPEIMTALWDHYTQNVDILVKVLYKPTVEALMKRASWNLQAISTADECLLFAIWLASVTTMSRRSVCCFTEKSEL